VQVKEFIIHFSRFLNIWNGEEPPESWLKAIIIPVYRKRYTKDCENERGINLLNSGCKIHTNTTKNKLFIYYKHKLCEEQNIS
jgi:hypothetical protein